LVEELGGLHQRDRLAVAQHLDLRARTLHMRVAGGLHPHVEELVRPDVDTAATPDRLFHFEPEERRRDDPDEGENYAEMDHVAAIAAIILRDQVGQCLDRWFTYQTTAGADSAAELGDNRAEHKRAER